MIACLTSAAAFFSISLIVIIRWDLLIMSVYHGAAPELASAHRTGKGEVTDE